MNANYSPESVLGDQKMKRRYLLELTSWTLKHKMNTTHKNTKIT